MAEAAFDAAQADLKALSPSKQKTYLRILTAATDRFVQFGYRRASIDDIARDAGIGKGTLYLYFSTKRDLLIACVTHEKLAMLGPLQDALELPEAEQLRAFVALTLRFGLSAPLTSRLVQGDAELSALFDEMDVDFLQANHAMALSLISPMVSAANPELAEAAVTRVSRIIGALMPVVAQLDQPLYGVSELTESIPDLLADIIAAGVAALEQP